MNVPARRGETSCPTGVGCRNPELVPATRSDVAEPGSLFCGLGGIRESHENPHCLRTEENTDNNLTARMQSVTNHSGRVTSSWVRGRPAHL